MTFEELKELLTGDPDAVVTGLQKTSYPNLPKWADLKKEYDPAEHKINSTTIYPPKLNENQQDDFKRTALALQKLAVNRVAQSMFTTPVKRLYDFNRDKDAEKEAIDILEEIYRTQNYIDPENIERCKKWGASCQAATIWTTYDKENIIKTEKSKLTLGHQTYSEIGGHKIYPIADPNGNLLVLSIGYTGTDNKEYFLVYVNGETPEHRFYLKEEVWELNAELSNPNLEVFPVVYINIPVPVWGGEDGTKIVEQIEEMESYDGLYIKRNAAPAFTLDMGDTSGMGKKKPKTTEKSDDARRIMKVGKGGGMVDVSWKGASEATERRIARLRNNFFEQIQVPDTSFANMIKSDTSAENKELIFSDSKNKAKDLGGEWEKLFYDEMKIVIAFAKVMFPKYAKIYDTITVRSLIQPYTLRTKKDNAEYVMMGGSAMSLETKIRILDEVEDVEAEADAISKENSASANQLFP